MTTDVKRKAARRSLVASGSLLVLKAAVGALSGSVGILAEAVNSAGDMVGAGVAWLAVRASDEPPDTLHAYGHGKIENLSGALTAGLVIGGGSVALAQAVQSLWHSRHGGHAPHALGAAIGVMALSAVVNSLVSQSLLKAGRDTDSPALSADGHHLRTDVYTSLSVLLGLILARQTGWGGWDGVAGVGVSLVIIGVGLGLARDALRTLTDVSLPAAEERLIANALLSYPGVLGFHKLRTRKSGSHRHVDVHVQVADTVSFVEAHRLTEALEDKLRTVLPNLHPMIHTEPHDDEDAHQRGLH